MSKIDGQLVAVVPAQLQSPGWLHDVSLSLSGERSVDFAGALVGLTLLAPVILFIALLIRLEEPRPRFVPPVAARVSRPALPCAQIPNHDHRRRATFR